MTFFAFYSHGDWIITRKPVGTLFDAIGEVWVATIFKPAPPPTEWEGVPVVVLGNQRRAAA